MIIVEQPYLSQFLKETIVSTRTPVLDTAVSRELSLNKHTTWINESEAILQQEQQLDCNLYTTSENALEWVIENLSATDYPHWVELFKNKMKFRQLVSKMYPDFYFREIAFDELAELNIEAMKFPFIIKPTIGFFSMGVKKVDSAAHWLTILKEIHRDIEKVKGLYPEQVLNPSQFIIEQYIEGDEYAFDAYFNDNGDPVILGIYKHVFSSSSDVSDRIYFTSKEIIQDNLVDFNQLLENIGKLTGIKNFPLHVEVRKDKLGIIVPIEVNPLRFGGWCSTADMTYHAYNFNPYEYYFNNKKPYWKELLVDKDDIYSIVILDNSTGINADDINEFNYDKLLKQFENPIELRKVDHREYPLFGFIFTQTRQDNFSELEAILTSDLRQFVIR